MRKRIMFTLLALLFWWNGAEAQSFDDYFIDKTLRVVICSMEMPASRSSALMNWFHFPDGRGGDMRSIVFPWKGMGISRWLTRRVAK